MEFNLFGVFDINLFDNFEESSSDEENNNIDIRVIREKKYIRDAVSPFTNFLQNSI